MKSTSTSLPEPSVSPALFENVLLKKAVIRCKDGAVEVLYSDLGALTTMMFDADSLRGIDARLPEALRAMSAIAQETAQAGGPGGIPGQWVADTLRHWRDPVTIGTLGGTGYFIFDILDFRQLLMRSKFYVEAVRYKPVTVDGLDLVTNTVVSKLFIGTDELSRLFPDWETRYQQMITLGLDAKSIGTHLLSKYSVDELPVVALPTLGFD